MFSVGCNDLASFRITFTDPTKPGRTILTAPVFDAFLAPS
jgi:hypothetical protein